MFCALSRRINRRLTGEDCLLCATAARRGWRVRHAIDVVLYLRDGPDHCLRQLAHEDTTGWASSPSPLDPIRRAGW